jgi:ABC-type sugar transport system permease subunit
MSGIELTSGPASKRRGPTGSALAFRRLSRRLTPLLFLAPALIFLIWLKVIPIGDAFRLSFTDWTGLSAPEGVGLDNYTELVDDPRFKSALLHNLVIVASIPVWIAIPYGIAWAIHKKIFGWSFFRFAFFLPVVLSPVVIGIYYGIVLKGNGPFNDLLRTVGLGGLTREWLNDPSTALPVVIAIIIWSTFGAGVLIFLSGLSSLDREQIDAARVDGASGWQVQRHVVFWQLLPVIEFWTILILIASFTVFFPLIFTLTHGGPGYATFTVDFDLYQEAFTAGHLGYASAIGVALMVIIGVIGGLAMALLRWRQH